ncbi:MAG: hypothetical protein ACJAT4_001448 [Granulosicoccus sp.]|jgi:hypothetical protein
MELATLKTKLLKDIKENELEHFFSNDVRASTSFPVSIGCTV